MGLRQLYINFGAAGSMLNRYSCASKYLAELEAPGLSKFVAELTGMPLEMFIGKWLLKSFVSCLNAADVLDCLEFVITNGVHVLPKIITCALVANKGVLFSQDRCSNFLKG